MGNPTPPEPTNSTTSANQFNATSANQYRGTSTPNGGTVVHPHLPGNSPSLDCFQTSRLRGAFAASRRLRGFAASSRSTGSEHLKTPTRLHVSVAIVGATVWLTALISSDSSTPKISSYPTSTLSMVFVPARGTSTATHPKACRAISIVLWGPRGKIRLDGGSLKFG